MSLKIKKEKKYFNRNSDRLGNGVLYASVNPEYFSASDGKLYPTILLESDLGRYETLTAGCGKTSFSSL